MTDTEDSCEWWPAPEVEAELDAALAVLRAEHPGLTNDVAAGLLSEHLRAPLWRRAVARYLAAETAKLEAIQARLAEIAESSDWDDVLRAEAALGSDGIGEVDPADDKDMKRALTARAKERTKRSAPARDAAKEPAA